MGALAWNEPEPIGGGSLVVRPQAWAEGLPVLYLLHGMADVPQDWCAENKGRLATLLSELPCPMTIVVPYCGGEVERTDPPLASVVARHVELKSKVDAQFQPDPARQGILGISMGAKQALSLVLGHQAAGFSVLGLLSGMFQGGYLGNVTAYAGPLPPAFADGLALYFHYCGQGQDVPRPGQRARLGDIHFFPSNQEVCTTLGGTIRTNAGGLHNWNFWRPEVAEFLSQVAELWPADSNGATPDAQPSVAAAAEPAPSTAPPA